MTFQKLIQNMCDGMGYTYMNDYTGRWMYGRECIAIVVPSGVTAFEVIADIVLAIDSEEYDLEDAMNNVRKAKMDGLGLNQVMYFPNVKPDEEYNADDLENESEEEDGYWMHVTHGNPLPSGI